MSNNNGVEEKKSSLLSSIISTVVITLLIGGAAPWWYNELFKKPLPPTPTPSASSPSPTTTTSNSNLDISSKWFDHRLGYTYEVIQNGNEFQFKTKGAVLGDPFESSGSGTITGKTVTSKYATQYESGRQSNGQCSGTISADGMHMTLTCTDSISGTFISTAVRQ